MINCQSHLYINVSRSRDCRLIRLSVGMCVGGFYSQLRASFTYLTRFNKIATQGAPQMAVDKEANSLSRVYSYYSKFTLRLFYV